MSLGLVSYDDSEESDNEDEPEASKVKIISTSIAKAVVQNLSEKTSICLSKPEKEIEHSEADPVPVTDARSFHLPQPKTGASLINTDIDIKCLTSTSTRNGPVRISIPSLIEIEDEDDQPSKKKLKPSQKGSGLFALLPDPKSNLVPQSVINRHSAGKKPATVTNATKITRPSPKPTTTSANKSSLISYDDSGEEDETTDNVDFFSLESKLEDVIPAPVDLPDVCLPEVGPVGPQPGQSSEALSFKSDFKPSMWAEASSSSSTYSSTSTHASQPASVNHDQYTTSDFMTFSTSDLELDKDAMQQLCGRRDRLKAKDMKVIDITGDEFMPDSREWLTKQLTAETSHRPSHKKKDGPTSQQKRKHQITYLAYQAKENELELKNQWANNRMSRKQTQAKYGF